MVKKAPSLQAFVKKPQQRIATRFCEAPRAYVVKVLRGMQEYMRPNPAPVDEASSAGQLQTHERHLRKHAKDITALTSKVDEVGLGMTTVKGEIAILELEMCASKRSSDDLSTQMTKLQECMQQMQSQIKSIQDGMKYMETSSKTVMSQPPTAEVVRPAAVRPTADLLLQAKSKLQQKQHSQHDKSTAESNNRQPAPSKPSLFDAKALQSAAEKLRRVDAFQTQRVVKKASAPETPFTPWTPAPSSSSATITTISAAAVKQGTSKAQLVLKPAVNLADMQALSSAQHAGHKRHRNGTTTTSTTTTTAAGLVKPGAHAAPAKTEGSWAAVVTGKAAAKAEVAVPKRASPRFSASPLLSDTTQQHITPADTENMPPAPTQRAKPAKAESVHPVVSAALLTSPRLRKTALDRSPGGTPIRKVRHNSGPAAANPQRMLADGFEKKFGALRRMQLVSSSPATSDMGSPFSPL